MVPPEPTRPTRHRILVADGHPVYLEALVATFVVADDIDIVAALGSLDAASDWLRAGDVDLVLADPGLPGTLVAACIAALRARFPATKVAIISGLVDPIDIRQVLQAGACGYLPKTFSPAMVVAAVRLMLAGAVYVPREILGRPSTADELTLDDLTPRERQILGLMARGLTNKAIGREIGIAEVTVKLHIRRLLAKLDARNRAGAVAIASTLGLVEAAD